MPPKPEIDEYLNNTRYLYDRAPKRPESFFTELINAFYSFIDWILSNTIFGENGNYYQLAALILIAFGVFYILKTKMYHLSAKTESHQSGASDVTVRVDETNVTDLDKLEAIYRSEGNNRGVVRVLYLRFLRKLADEKLLSLDNKKTNWEYASELRNSRFYKKFIHATLLYENSWYGRFEVNEDDLANFRHLTETGVES